MITIVAPDREDVPALARLAEASYSQGFAGILEPEALAERDAAFFARRFAADLTAMRLARDGREVLGFSMVHDGHLDMLFVAPSAQGRGVGAALLAEAEARGTRTLECFRDNHAARRFYEAKGWRLTRSYSRDFVGRERDFVFYEKG